MQTLTHAPARCHATIRFTTTRPTEFVDITDRLQSLIAGEHFRFGILNVQSLHTTTAIVVNEHEPLLLDDFEAVLERTASHAGRYGHDNPAVRTVNVTDDERPNGHAHCRALLMPSNVCLNVNGGRLLLGRWQRVFLVELDGPREREVSVLAVGEAGQ
jgi:secondary thiamine-phosphate synthase enzyme